MRAAGVASLMLALALALPAAAHERARSRTGAPRHWVERQLTYRVVESPELPSLREATAEALRVWQAPCASMTFREARDDEVPDLIIQRADPEDWQHPATQGAWTDVEDGESRTGVIQRAAITLNGAFVFSESFLDSRGAPAKIATLDLVGILAHEFGHALGLAHSLQRGALMHLGVKPGKPLPKSLTEDDRKLFCLLYPKEVEKQAR